ncbi:hypothetical protein [Nonomuraea typhae]|nr:hypothetical protein [Nonomuraea typhae]
MHLLTRSKGTIGELAALLTKAAMAARKNRLSPAKRSSASTATGKP